MPIRWTRQTSSDALKYVMLQYGETLSYAKYKGLKLEGTPSVDTLTRLFGSWVEAKSSALPSSADTGRQSLIRQNKLLLARLEKQRNVTHAIIDTCQAEVAKLNIKPVPIYKKSIKSKEKLDVFLMRSDAQVGEYINADDVQGLSSYDMDIYKERHDKLIGKVMTFLEQDRPSLGLEHLIIPHLGDQVEGEAIYPGQAFNLDAHLVDQLFYSVEVESSGLLSLAKEFKEITILCVPGNHGRPGVRGQNHPKTNFDYIFYHILKLVLKPQSNIHIHISESPSMIIKRGKFTFLLNHGDSAKGWAGIPYYGLDRQFHKLSTLYNMIINYELVGHHHQATNLSDRILINGCLPGGSDLSINRMTLSSHPSQTMFYFHPNKGINRESKLYLGDPVELKPDKHGIYTSHI